MRSRQGKHSARRGKGDAYHHGDLRRALLAAALRVLEKGGTEALSLREVARRAGVTHAAPYRHFESREALLAAVAAEGFELLKASMDRRAAKVKSAKERMLAIGEGYVAFAAEHPVHFGVMFQAFGGETPEHAALQASASAAFGVLMQSVQACQASKDAREGEPMELALGAWCLVHGAAMLQVHKVTPPGVREISVTQMGRVLGATLFRGIG